MYFRDNLLLLLGVLVTGLLCASLGSLFDAVGTWLMTSRGRTTAWVRGTVGISASLPELFSFFKCSLTVRFSLRYLE